MDSVTSLCSSNDLNKKDRSLVKHCLRHLADFMFYMFKLRALTAFSSFVVLGFMIAIYCQRATFVLYAVFGCRKLERKEKNC